MSIDFVYGLIFGAVITASVAAIAFGWVLSLSRRAPDPVTADDTETTT